jgi:UDPglucose 6-dehydrogenase
LKITIIGSGYVGLVTGACLSEFGFYVTCVDKDEKKISLLSQSIVSLYEPGLNVMIANNLAKGRLSFVTNIQSAIKKADIVFIAVGTPSSLESGQADLSHVYSVAEDIALAIEKYTVIVTKSTVPVGTGKKIAQLVRQKCPDAEFDIVSNPEFLREGSAIEDFMKPDRVVIGTEKELARPIDIMREVYRPLSAETPVIFTSLETAELIKYASNTFLATKLAFINEIADLCEKCGADVQSVAKGMGLDKRIGERFLNAGTNYGGSCLPKDNLALIQTAKNYGLEVSIIDAVVKSNNRRKKIISQKIIAGCGGNVEEKTICILGVTIKPNTDDMRDAPSLDIISSLIKAGSKIHVCDPQGEKEGRRMLPSEVKWFECPYKAMTKADAVVIMTEWNEFRALDFDKMRELLNRLCMIDLRNIYLPSHMQDQGFDYISVGRPSVYGNVAV